ncbi:phage tail protein [Rathayibacter sp. YIM 133350]|uniref:phage tail protein n=1 Tax=Rathayibacter sp. YIM 133350 TaxID=3131992 RepID=UPI00307D8054
MRGIVPGLVSPSPFITRVPAILQDDDFLQRMLPAFDDTLAPVFAVLDNLTAYIDPQLAPADFLEWIGGWVDIAVDEAWSQQQRRDIIAGAAALHHRLGTASGIRDAVRLAAGPEASVDVEESGGTASSRTPGGALPGSDAPGVRVRVGVAEGDVDALQHRLERVAMSLVPAHVPCTVVVQGPGKEPAGATAPAETLPDVAPVTPAEAPPDAVAAADEAAKPPAEPDDEGRST